MAILKINGEELLGTRDDGAFLDILKSFFQSIGNPNDHNQNTGLTVKKKKEGGGQDVQFMKFNSLFV